MAPPIIFARTDRLTVAGPTLSISSIPSTARHLFWMLRARLDSATGNNQWIGMRFNGDAGANYDSVAVETSTSGTFYQVGIAGDGLGITQFILSELNDADAPAGMFTEMWGFISDYGQATQHALQGWGQRIFDDGNIETEYRSTICRGYHDSGVAISSIDILNEAADNLAIDSSLTIWGMADVGDVATISRGALGGAPTPTLDFDPSADQILDYTATNAAQTFSATNVTLGRELYINVTGGGGSTTLTMPAGTDVLEDNYVAGADAWIIIKVVNETGPQLIANIKDVV